MNSYQNKKRKRNLVKKERRKIFFIKQASEFLDKFMQTSNLKDTFRRQFEEQFMYGRTFYSDEIINHAMGKLIPKAIDNLPEYKFTEEQLEILKRRATN
jgi:hypothetical protein